MEEYSEDLFGDEHGTLCVAGTEEPRLEKEIMVEPDERERLTYVIHRLLLTTRVEKDPMRSF